MSPFYSPKNKILIIGLILAMFVGIFYYFQTSSRLKSNNQSAVLPNLSSTPAGQNDKPQIVSTKPDPLEDNIVSVTDTVEITFNRPLENVGEFKSKLEPKIDYKVELSSDRKTAKIIPTKPYNLGTTYTLFIGPETKFDGIGRWGEEKIFHFKTITYRGV